MNHIHESPKSMAIPLMVLGVLSFVGGFMNVPEALAGSARLEEFLSPVFNAAGSPATHHHLDHATEYLLMAIVVGLTLIVIWIAFMRFVRKRQVPQEDGQLVAHTGRADILEQPSRRRPGEPESAEQQSGQRQYSVADR